MKKTKVLLILFLILFISILPFSYSNAHSVDLDQNKLISFPLVITNGSGSITIKSSETGYSLYYQAVEISNTIYDEIEKTTNDGNAELKNIKAEIDTLDNECDNLKTIYDEALENYKNATEEQKEQAKTAYETAKTNYQNKVTEYNNKVKEYNSKYEEISSKVKKLTPTYIENNWVKTNDNKFTVDLSKFSGEKAFAVWAKLVSSDGTISYDEATYTMSGTKVNEVEVESISLDKTALSIKEGSNYTLTATITPSNATNKSVVWSSNNENVAKVQNGKVTAIAKGTAIITATTENGKHAATCTVTVTEASNNKTNNSDTNNSNNIVSTTKKDDTTAKGVLPNTGIGMTAIAIIIIAIGSSAIAYFKYNKLKGI